MRNHISFFSFNAFAEKCTSGFSRSFSFTPDVGFGNQYKKSLGNNFKKHGVCIVEKSQGHPTRLGQQSLRFEVKPGDCGYNEIHSDCKKDRERHELSGRRHNGAWMATQTQIGPSGTPLAVSSSACAMPPSLGLVRSRSL